MRRMRSIGDRVTLVEDVNMPKGWHGKGVDELDASELLEACGRVLQWSDKDAWRVSQKGLVHPRDEKPRERLHKISYEMRVGAQLR